jgi:hypothetical protein
MKNNAYVGATQRNFQQALIHCLESDYALMGSRKILELMTSDIQQLVDQFYPPSGHLSNGWMFYTGTKATSQKPYPGMRAGEFELVTIPWPILILDDMVALNQLSEAKADRQPWWIKRLVRIIEHGLNHEKGPVLLTLADLGLMVGLTARDVSALLKIARQQTGKPLTTKGQYFDIGMKPTHKCEIIELYEQGCDEVAIARKSGHDQTSVGRYIRDYERVKEAVQNSMPFQSIPRLLDLLPSVVEDYTEMVYKYYPDIEIYVKDQKND